MCDLTYRTGQVLRETALFSHSFVALHHEGIIHQSGMKAIMVQVILVPRDNIIRFSKENKTQLQCGAVVITGLLFYSRYRGNHDDNFHIILPHSSLVFKLFINSLNISVIFLKSPSYL